MTNQDGSSPLHVAALHGRVDLVPLLLKHGASVGARNAKQAVPLHLACQQGHFQVRVLSLGQSVRGLAFGRNRSCWECCTGARVGRLTQSTALFLPPSPKIPRCTWQDHSATAHRSLMLLGWSQSPSHCHSHVGGTGCRSNSEPSRSCLWSWGVGLQGSGHVVAPFHSHSPV